MRLLFFGRSWIKKSCGPRAENLCGSRATAARLLTSLLMSAGGDEALESLPVKRKLEEEEEAEEPEPTPLRKVKVKKELKDLNYEESDYYFEGYLRKVYPYSFEYSTHCKGRWVGRKLIEVTRSEFRALAQDKILGRFESGATKVNGEKVPADYVLKDNDLLTNRVHRHELPVLAADLKIVVDSDLYLVVDKPPSIPVHPCGRYRLNSVVVMLAKEYGYKGLHVLHRLDRLTSGCLLFAKTLEKAHAMEKEIRERSVRKEYLCRVDGNFPDEEISCEEAIEVLTHKIGICVVSKQGKESSTSFRKLDFNGTSSLVLCKPKTGRMHQIRVHLQFLGFPIVNDPLYNSLVFGPNKGKHGDYGGKTKEQLLDDIISEHSSSKWVDYDVGPVSPTKEAMSSLVKDTEAYNDSIAIKWKNDIDLKRNTFDASKLVHDSDCDECCKRFVNPLPKHLMIYLHALRYSGDNWDFQTEPPYWAQHGWTDT